jgi:hypothetical protein
MPVNVAAIEQNSNQMFALLNDAQQKQNDLQNDVATLNTESKLRASADASRGQVIDLYV